MTKAIEPTCLKAVYAAAAMFCVATCGVSYARWANFEYRTFDLAYYVQAIWQLVHGRFEASVLHVPLLGNHVEPIVILFAPLFALFQHPMVFVIGQNAALATMAPVGFNLARRLGAGIRSSALLAVALLLTPASGYIALHEFHPEALTAPFLLLMLQARAAGSVRRHWLWFVAVLLCKENMALLLIAYCVVKLVMERRRPGRELWSWYGWPLFASIGWFVLCAKVITPAFNSGDVDYLALYNHLGHSAGDIVGNFFRHPLRIVATLWHAAANGSLVWGLLLPFLGLPLLRPGWLMIASPIFLQHLLSWRSSEWTIYFHYAAPLLPLLWIGMVEVISGVHSKEQRRIPAGARNTFPLLVVFACISAQAWLGPAQAMATTVGRWSARKLERDEKNAFISVIPANASVTAPLPYLSHLATREKLYSLHYILKGLKTLSRSAYEAPPPAEFVLIDYGDTATFDSSAGYYHPAMQTADGRLVPSSDRLLHELLRQRSWTTISVDELTLLRQMPSAAERPLDAGAPEGIANLDSHTRLLAITKETEHLAPNTPIEIHVRWWFEGERDLFPWMTLVLAPSPGGEAVMLERGLCAPEAGPGIQEENWKVTASDRLAAGEYSIAALFRDKTRRGSRVTADDRRLPEPLLCAPVPLGKLHVDALHKFAP